MTSIIKNTPSHRSAIIGMALLVGLFAASVHADEYTKTFTVANRANVRVDTNDGAVVVTTGDTQQVEFRVEYHGYVLDKSLQIDSTQHGDEVNLTARIPSGIDTGKPAPPSRFARPCSSTSEPCTRVVRVALPTASSTRVREPSGCLPSGQSISVTSAGVNGSPMFTGPAATTTWVCLTTLGAPPDWAR